jgi:hypothetical protein
VVALAAYILVTGLGSAAAGYLAGGFRAVRFLAVLAVSLVWPVLYLGIDQGWWGSGLGDGWQLPALVLTATALITSIGGAYARRGGLSG